MDGYQRNHQYHHKSITKKCEESKGGRGKRTIVPEPCTIGCGALTSQSLALVSQVQVTLPTTSTVVFQRGLCSQELEAKECAMGYIRRCMKSLAQQFAGVLVQSATREVQSWCSDRKNEYLSSARCFSPYGPQIHGCMTDLISKLDIVAADDTIEDKLGVACCSFGGYRQCTLDVVKGICDEDTVAFLDNLLSAYASELLDLACSGHEHGSDLCNSLDLPVANDTQKSLSLLGPLSVIVTSL